MKSLSFSEYTFYLVNCGLSLVRIRYFFLKELDVFFSDSELTTLITSSSRLNIPNKGTPSNVRQFVIETKNRNDKDIEQILMFEEEKRAEIIPREFDSNIFDNADKILELTDQYYLPKIVDSNNSDIRFDKSYLLESILKIVKEESRYLGTKDALLCAENIILKIKEL